jgi:hypothetical protein
MDLVVSFNESHRAVSRTYQGCYCTRCDGGSELAAVDCARKVDGHGADLATFCYTTKSTSPTTAHELFAAIGRIGFA